MNINMKPEVRDLAFVPRWGIVRTIRHQNVAEHSYFVALIVDDLINWVNAKAPFYHIAAVARNQMMLLALFHDLSEAVTGDITGPIKKNIVDRKKYDEFVRAKEHEILGWSVTETANNNLASHELFIVKLADFLESVLFIIDETKLGNCLGELRVSLINTLYLRLEDAKDTFDGTLVDVLHNYVNQALNCNSTHSNINHYEPQS